MNKIITIGREFGSGGREIGRRLSENLGFAYYDQEIISEIAKRTSLSEKYVEAIVEQHSLFSFPIHIGRSFYPVADPALDQTLKIYQEQTRIILEMARKSDCVIVGRCADFILKEENPFRIFVYADVESKLRRCRTKGPSQENLSDRELKQKMSGIDKKRANYYELLTGRSWGNKLNYDLCINTSGLDIKQLAQALANLFR